MYLFLYKALKHRTYYSRLKQSNVKGELDLRKLRNATRGDVKVWGCGTHPVQHVLAKANLLNYFKGHILATEDPSVAMWIKLNYDMLGKNGTHYTNSYRNIDVEHLEKLVDSYMSMLKERTTNQNGRSLVVNLQNNLQISQRYLKEGRLILSDHTKDNIDALEKLLEKESIEISESYLALSGKVDKALVAIEKYLASCGLDPASR